jgi:CHASE2 domain-containing sensor protein
MAVLRRQSGVYINAQALASELQGYALREVSEGWLLAAKVLAGILMALVAAIMPSRVSVYLHVIIVPASALIAAFLAASINYWLDFVPVLMAGFIDQWYHDLRAQESAVRDQ